MAAREAAARARKVVATTTAAEAREAATAAGRRLRRRRRRRRLRRLRDGGGSALHPVWQRQASLACHRFSGAALNQEWRGQRGPARTWPTYQQNSSLFSRAPTQNFSSAARRQARRRRRKKSGGSPTCRFHEEIGPSCAPACSLCGPAPAASHEILQSAQHRLSSANLPNAPVAQWSWTRRAAARRANGGGATRARRCPE